MSGSRLDPGAIPYHLLAGLVLGCLFAVGECAWVLLGGGSSLSFLAFLPVSLFYMIIWGAWGAGLGAAAALLHAILGGSGTARRRAGWSTVQILVSVAATIGVAVNVYHLPAARSTPSLLFDAALGALLLGAFFPLRRLLQKAMRSSPWTVLRRALYATAAALAVMAVPLLRGGPGVAAEAAGQTRQGDPSVLFLIVDSLRARQVGGYGYPRARTPHLDRLGRTGFVGEHMMAQASRTKESTASIFTGTYPSTHRMSFLTSAVPAHLPILPELMRHSGYVTAILTANTLVSPLFGFDRGVDFFYAPRRSVIPTTFVAHLMDKVGNKIVRAGLILDVVRWSADNLPAGTPTTAFHGEDARDMNGALLDWIGRYPDRSHCVYVHYMEPHADYDPPAPFDVMFLPPETRDRKYSTPPRTHDLAFPLGAADPVGAGDLEIMLGLHDGEIASWDHAFGGFLRGLDELGVRGSTLILVTADHGEAFFEHGAWEHGQSLFQEEIHVPLVASWPGRLLGPRVDRDVAQHVDLLPTALDLAGLPADGLGLPGRSLLPRLLGAAGEEAPLQGRIALTELVHGTFELRALTGTRYKLIHCRDLNRTHQVLYDLMADPAEGADLSEQEVRLRDDLLAELGALRDAAAEHAGVSESVALDPETEATLRALGYLE